MIYLIQNCEFLKIGYIENVEERLKSYNTHNPDFELIGVREGNKEFEAFLQNKYSSLRVRNEWFKYSESLIQDFFNYKDENYNFPEAYPSNHVKVYTEFEWYLTNFQKSAYSLLLHLHYISSYNTGVVIFSPEQRKKYMEIAKVKSNSVTNALKQLEDAKLIKREKDKTILLNILPIWKGDNNVRAVLLKDSHRQEIFNYKIIK